MTRLALTAERVLAGDAFRRDVAVVIEGSNITAILDRDALPHDIPLDDLGPGILAPGLIDLQVNGGGGVLLNETPTVEGVRAIAEAHRCYGTTGLLPTVITDTPEVMRAATDAVRDARWQGVPGVLGIHIEGPFIDPKRKGAHDPRYIRRPSEEDIAWLTGLDCGVVYLTLAPNMVDLDIVRRLAKTGIVVSLGHSEATSLEALAALRAGARGFTHLFNAMSQLTGRAPGMVGAALSAREAWCGLIADGEHVDEIALRAALAAKRPGTLVLVSDAMPSAADGPDAFRLQGREVRVRNGRLELMDGTLAGATITLIDAVRFAYRRLDLNLEEALRMASQYPAEAIGLGASLGRLAPGYDATFVHLSDGLEVLRTWTLGRSSQEI